MILIRRIKKLAWVLCLSMYCVSVLAVSHSEWQVGFGERYMSYKHTPREFAKDSGYLFGIYSQYKYFTPIEFGINLSAAQGKLDYNTTDNR